MKFFIRGKQEETHVPITDDEREAINDVGYSIAHAETRAEQLEQVERFHALGGTEYRIIPCGPQGSGRVTHYEKRRRDIPMVTWQHINATIDAAIEQLDDIVERSLALKLAMGLWAAIAVPTFLVWMIEQQSTISAADRLFLIMGDALLFAVWATLTVFLHIRNHHERVQESEHEPHENV